MTAPNTPTPELEPVAWAFDRPETPYQFWTTNPEADNLKREKLIPLVRHDQAAAAITKLTAERDGYKEAYDDTKRLARLVDVALCGEEGAAKQASLCDLVSVAQITRARAEAADAMLRELKAATGHDDGLLAIRHLVLRATQAENYITATEPNQPITVNFDKCLNDLGWQMNDFLVRNGATFDGRVFNNMKSFLRDAITQYISSKESGK